MFYSIFKLLIKEKLIIFKINTYLILYNLILNSVYTKYILPIEKMGSKYPPHRFDGGNGDLPPLPSDEAGQNKSDDIFERRRDSGGRPKRKFDNPDSRPSKGDGRPSGRKSEGPYSKRTNRYELEEKYNRNSNSLNGGNKNNCFNNMEMPPLPSGPGPQLGMNGNQMQPSNPMMMNPMGPMGMNPMMGNIMNPTNAMMNMGNINSGPMNPQNMGPMNPQNMGPMNPQNMSGMNPPNLNGINPSNMNGMNAPNMMIGQFPMMPMSGTGAEGAMQALMTPLMNEDTMNIFQRINTREPIHFSNFVLYPPSPKAPPPTTRERPPGCKTIFIGGLPEMFNEEQLIELFSKCGEIQNCRLSTKRFAHLRFMSEMSVDMALYFSGYRIRIEDKTDNPNTGRLHIDFAQARDDQYEYECQQRILDRERRHQQRLLIEQFRVPSPPSIIHYSDHEANVISDKIKNDETFEEALNIVCTWLERGDCTKRNATTFYTILQSANSHVRRLVSEKAIMDEEFQRARDLHVAKISSLSKQYNTVEKVFLAASQKKVWDHFTKAQRKSIESWKKGTADIKILMPDDVDDMDTDSDSDDDDKKKSKGMNKNALKDENDSLRCQLEAYKNEVEIIKSDMQNDLEIKDEQIKVSQKTIENMQKSILDAKKEQNEASLKAAALSKELEGLKKKVKDSGVEGINTEESEVVSSKIEMVESFDPGSIFTKISERDAKLIGLISIFLHIHPFGASVDYIWSYVQKFDSSVKVSDVETLMGKYPLQFTQDLFGIGANIERRWKYFGLTSTT